MSESWTLGRLLRWTTDYLQQQGAETPRLDAEVLLAESRGCTRIALYTAFDEPADDALRDRFRKLVKRRAEGTPVAYLTGRREFYSLSFEVTPDVLIPRPETEHLVVRLIDLAKQRSSASPLRIADVGVGSGIISICAARHISQATIAALDISPAALEVAKRNAETHKVADRIEWSESDLFSALPPDRKFDLVASNPPYVSEPEFAALPKTVRDFEPRIALVGGPTGVELIARLVAESAPRLHSGGWLLLEISPMIEPAVRRLIEQHGEFQPGPTVKDFAHQPRIVQAQKR